MELVDAAKLLLRLGAILGIFLGIISMVFWINLIFLRSFAPVISVNIFEVLMFTASLIAVIACYFIIARFEPRWEDDPFRAGLILIALGIIVAIGAWGIAGLLLVISGVLILIDETS